MLEDIRKFALEKFAGDQEQADAFVQGFVQEVLTKQASERGGDRGFGAAVANGIGGAIGKGVGGLAMGLGMHGMSSLMNSVKSDRLHSEFLQALQRAIASNRILKEANKDKVKNYAETIFRFAPHVATDSNLLSSVLANAVHGEGIDPMTVRSLTDLESRYTEGISSPAFSPKAYV